ncbi:histidine phosphatase family protein [Corynebacterium hylobatis]|uniref:Histidine phosphatase family protein n=1 Tax=Corynebacterium hylobatis TaxID=1859290 RepID=A0A3R9ZFB5_9CORY|nr:histidine phosphatase family protein [Corynebacterium hylobatis]RSZ64734.1 histidine phosphatase family protein [Corynebacterium hylobatis]
MTGRLILLRHGQTYSNVARRLDTRPPGAELTDTGRNQAWNVGEELVEFCGAGNGSAGRLGAVISSVALRAQQTALLAMNAFEQSAGLEEFSMRIDVLPGIHEIYAGEHEMLADDDSHRSYATALRGWLDGDDSALIPGGETYLELMGRYQPVMEELVLAHLADGASRDVLMVSHGAAIRTMATHAAAVDPDFAFAGYLGNCRFIVLEPGDRPFGQWKLVRWADVDHQI